MTYTKKRNRAKVHDSSFLLFASKQTDICRALPWCKISAGFLKVLLWSKLLAGFLKVLLWSKLPAGFLKVLPWSKLSAELQFRGSSFPAGIIRKGSVRSRVLRFRQGLCTPISCQSLRLALTGSNSEALWQQLARRLRTESSQCARTRALFCFLPGRELCCVR